MQLLVVRHGQARLNQEHRYLGALDPELALEGWRQAQALRDILSGAVDEVLCSPLLRARQTAQVICIPDGRRPIEAPWLRERHVGVFEGLTQDEAQSRFPDLWAQQITRQWTGAPPGGETIQEVVTRVGRGLASLAPPDPRRRVALVCHGFVAKVIRALCGAGFDDFFEWQLANGAVLDISASTFVGTQERSPGPPLGWPPALVHHAPRRPGANGGAGSEQGRSAMGEATWLMTRRRS
jgi:2,3-bisphosphoglycerate-dependent phosphoglycerate mutase